MEHYTFCLQELHYIFLSTHPPAIRSLFSQIYTHMDNHQNQQRIKSLFKMLLEMACGNLSFRVELVGSNDEIEDLAVTLNNTAKKMQLVISKYNTFYPLQNDQSNADAAKQFDEELIQKVLNYIQNHLEEPLPSTKKLSEIFKTNEFTLKDNFRKIVKTSIYQFYNDERLKKAHFLIQQSVFPLKEIALISGFNSYPNFYKAFKKKYKYTPTEVNRQNKIQL